MSTADRLVSTTPAAWEGPSESKFTPPLWYFDLPRWVKDPTTPGNAAHNYAFPVRVRGKLNQEALKHSLQELIRRHQVLRSAFRIENGELVQVILRVEEMDVPEWDFRQVPTAEREQKALRFLSEDARRPFDLGTAPIFRTGLLRLADEEHIVLITTHHVICDDWSTRIIIRDLFTLYDAFNRGTTPAAPDLKYQFCDFADWLQNTRLRKEQLNQEVEFWKQRLTDDKGFHHIGPSHPRPPIRSFRGTHEVESFGASLGAEIVRLSRQERVTPFMVLLAALQCLLARNSGDTRIGVGTCAANRPLSEVEALVGPFANVSVIQSRVSDNSTFRELLKAVRTDCLTAYSNQNVPFGCLVQHLHQRGEFDRNPFFQVLLVTLSRSDPPTVPGLVLEPITLDTGTTRYELNFWIELEGEFVVDLQYNSDLFDEGRIRALLHEYREVLQSVCARPDQKIWRSDCESEPGPRTGERTAVSQSANANEAIEIRLRQIWEAVLERSPIGVNDDFFEIGGDSLRANRIFCQIEQTFRRAIPIGALTQSPTIAQLARLIATPEAVDPCIVLLQQGHHRPPLFCIPGQTGSVLMFRDLARHLGADQPVHGLQPQGLDGVQAPLRRIEEIAANFVSKIRMVQPEGPYFLSGFCMGGTVAMEMAQQLQSLKQDVGLLALVETYNWSQLKYASHLSDFQFRVEQYWFTWQVGGLRRQVLSERGLRSALAVALPGRDKALRKYRDFFTKPAAEAVSDCNRDAALSYMPRLYSGNILHISANREYSRLRRPEMSLERFAPGRIEYVVVDANPYQLFQDPAVRAIASRLREAIDASILSRVTGKAA